MYEWLEEWLEGFVDQWTMMDFYRVLAFLIVSYLFYCQISDYFDQIESQKRREVAMKKLEEMYARTPSHRRLP